MVIPECCAEAKQRIGSQNKVSELIKELAESDDTYDIRFWPNKRISKEAISLIASEQSTKNFNLGRTEYLIKEIIKHGGPTDSIYAALILKVKEKCKEKAEHWWKEQNTFYRERIDEALKSKDVAEIDKWLGHAIQHYSEYCYFCKYAGIKNEEIPVFISAAEVLLNTLKANSKKEVNQLKNRPKDNSDQKSLKSNSKYPGKYPDEPPTEKQLGFLDRLCREKSYILKNNPGELTRKQVSELISQLLSK